ncbi:MAG: STAS domain-containing protein [Pseudonocardiales bacterium]|nr:STAS domain-containing protein [Pseudonocardiales bacterium]
MALLPSTQGRAGPLSTDVLDLHVTEHGTDARVVTVRGEIDALTAPELGGLLTAQLAAAPLVVVDLERVRFLGSAGLSVLLQPMNSLPGKTATCGWSFTTGAWLIEPLR